MARGKGEGSVYRRGDGYWVAAIEAGRYPNGRRRKLRAVRRYKADALGAMDELRRQAGAGSSIDRRQTVTSFLIWWLDNVKANDVAESTLRQYRGTRIGQWITPSIGHVRLTELRRYHVEQMRAALADKSASTWAQALGTLREAMSWATANELISRNPTDGVKAPLDEPTKVCLTDQEADAIAATATSENDRLLGLWEMNVRFGMRTGEVLALSWSDVDWDRELLTINGTKSKRSARIVPLLPGAREVLLAHRKRQAAERLAAPFWTDDDLVFTDQTGRPLGQRKATDLWHALCERAGMTQRKKFTAARKHSVSVMYRAGVRVEHAALFHGHTVAVMQSHYLVIEQEDHRAEMLKAFS